MSGSVAELVNSDVIMDHLMEDGIFDKVFGQVDTGVDTEDKVFVSGRAEEPGAMFGEGEFAKESAGMGELDGDGRQGTAEKTGIELVKAGLDVGDGGNHGTKIAHFWDICKFLSEKLHFRGKKFGNLKKMYYLCREFQELEN